MPDDVDPATWWNQQLAGSRLIVERLSTGTEYFELTLVPSQPHEPDPDFPRYLKIARFEKEVRSLFGSSDPLSRQSELEQMHDNRTIFQASPDELPVIDTHRL